jgi:hypothetical protein
VPGQIGKAWKWRLEKPLTKDLAKRLREATQEANRTGGQNRGVRPPTPFSRIRNRGA